ncbi:MAG: CcmD family protein [Flavipsychrobacter sp.]
MRKHFFLLTLLTLFTSVLALAQESTPEMADVMRKDGKIYVVVLVLATIFAGIIFFLIRIDRKLKKLENNNNS